LGPNNAKTKAQILQEGQARFAANSSEVEEYILSLSRFGQTDDPNTLCARIVTMSGIFPRAKELAGYFRKIHETTFYTLKVQAGKLVNERMAEADARRQTGDLKELVEKADGVLESIERMSANYNAVLDWKEAELNSMGRRS